MTELATTPALTDEDRREALRQKIAASEARNAERSFADQAREVADGALDYVRANPIKSVAAVAVSALAIGALTRRGRKTATKASKRTGKLASVVSDAVIAYTMSLLDSAGHAAEAGQDKLSDLGETVGGKARRFGRYAAKESGDVSSSLQKAAKKTGRSTGKRIKDMRARMSH